MLRLFSFALFLFCTFFSVHNVFAQRLTERWLTINPLGFSQATKQETLSFLHSSDFWGEFGAYRITRDNDHAWSVKFGGFIELFRFSQDKSLAFLSSIDLIADPHNDIRFNPRAVYWEEGFLYTVRANSYFYQFGYYHRCKHDVDNYPAGPNYPFPVQRALIYGSMLGKIIFPWEISQNVSSLVSYRLDIYTILQDARVPKRLEIHLPHLYRMQATLGANTFFHFRLIEPWLGAYITSYAGLTSFGKNEGFFNRFSGTDMLRFNGGIGSGIIFQGALHLRMGISYEYVDDTNINPIPTHANLILLSIILVNNKTMR